MLFFFNGRTYLKTLKFAAIDQKAYGYGEASKVDVERC